MTQQVQAHILKKYSLVKKVGSGAYGHVWKVTDKKTGEVLALKKIFDAFQHSTDAQRTYRQIVFLHELNHPNIIKLFNVIKAENDKDLYLVFEYSQADLHNAIGQKILKDAHNRYILYQLVKGLKYMHSAQVIHRDLKPSNLLLNSDCLLKICDFGLARSLAINKNEEKDIVLTEQVATRWYRAPEVLLGSNNYDKSADIWSVGCILAEILIGKPIFSGNSTLNQLQKILSFTGKPKPEDIEALYSEVASTMINQVTIKQKPLHEWFKPCAPDEAISLVLNMLSFNPKKRPTASQILRHSYLNSFFKPKEQIISSRAIQPPISDNTKLNLKEYRRLIYERIKKLYPQQKDNQSELRIQNEQLNHLLKKSIDRNNQKQKQKHNFGKQKQKQKKVYTQGKQNYSSTTKIQSKKQERPYSQNLYNKNSTNQNQNLTQNNAAYRAIKTSNSSHVSGKADNNRYFSSIHQQKAPSNSVSQKYQGSSPSNSNSIHRNASDEKEIKKKNSLKDILKIKKQTNVQNNYNIQQNTPQTASKVLFAGNVTGQYFSNSSSNSNNGKVYASQSGYQQQQQNDPNRYPKYGVPGSSYQNPTNGSKYMNYGYSGSSSSQYQVVKQNYVNAPNYYKETKPNY